MAELNLLTTKATGTITYGIDASSANKEKRTGVEHYARELIQALKNHPLKENERVILFSPSLLDSDLSALPTGWSSKVLKWPLTRGWMAGRMSWELRRRRPSLLFVPGQALPWFAGTAITTIHDVAFARRPDLYDPAVRRRLERITKRAVKKAKRLLVPSQATARDVIELYHAAPEQVIVTLEAVNTKLFHPHQPKDARAILQRHRLGTNFFLAVGRMEKKKNLSTLIRAFELFKTRRGVGDPFELVLVGEPGYGYDEIKRFIDFSSYKEHIRPLGYLPDQDVSPLMSAATAYLFPSWYEGFGIPNLEAMASGVALVTSDIPAHREVAGEAALFVPPGEPEAWTQAMQRVVKEGSLRAELVEKGKQQVAGYAWERTAAQTLDIFRSLV